MTRAREHLIISCAPTGRRSNGSFLSMLDETFQENIATVAESKTIAVGSGSVELRLVPENLVAPGRAKSHRRKADKKPNWQPYVDTWARRRNAYESAIKTPVFVTPTLLKQQEEDVAEAARRTMHPSRSPTPSMLVGELAHRFLESWDFAQDGENYGERMGPFLDQWLPLALRTERAQIHADLTEIFSVFFGSKIHSELASSQILGREIPLLIPWDGQIMEGVIDLIYEHDGLLYLADYKTDRIAREELTQGAERYRQQAQIYSRAAQESLQREVAAFKVIFLRLGEAVRVPLHINKEISSPVQLRLL
jgi:ATP-dependent helicase/nuclease subunit A